MQALDLQKVTMRIENIFYGDVPEIDLVINYLPSYIVEQALRSQFSKHFKRSTIETLFILIDGGETIVTLRLTQSALSQIENFIAIKKN
jgi:hypothetical protein